jgi:hypothetical protein
MTEPIGSYFRWPPSEEQLALIMPSQVLTETPQCVFATAAKADGHSRKRRWVPKRRVLLLLHTFLNCLKKNFTFAIKKQDDNEYERYLAQKWSYVLNPHQALGTSGQTKSPPRQWGKKQEGLPCGSQSGVPGPAIVIAKLAGNGSTGPNQYHSTRWPVAWQNSRTKALAISVHFKRLSLCPVSILPQFPTTQGIKPRFLSLGSQQFRVRPIKDHMTARTRGHIG